MLLPSGKSMCVMRSKARALECLGFSIADALSGRLRLRCRLSPSA